MTTHDKLKVVDFCDIGIDPDVIMRNFIVVKIRDLFPASTLPCDFYFYAVDESTKVITPEKLLKKGEEYAREMHSYLIEEEIYYLYIRPEDEDIFLRYLNTEMQRFIRCPDIPTEKKTELLYDNAEIVVKKVFREHPNESNILLGKQLVGDLALHLTTEHVSVKALLSLFSKDYYTFNHCVQVAMLGMSFCSFLGWSRKEAADFGLGALFHDVGKNSISEEILNKPGKLNREEFDVIKTHPEIGYNQLRQAKILLQDQLDIVLFHHEANDGSGYPEGLAGDKIPRYARVAHITDVFDALTSQRVYKNSLSQSESIKLMMSEMRYSFDDELLLLFSQFIEETDKVETKAQERASLKIGTNIFLQLKQENTKIRSMIVGLEENEYLILKSSPWIQDKIMPGTQLIGRCICEGNALGFVVTVTDVISDPYPLIILTYPKKMEQLNLRSEERVASLLPAKIQIRDEKCKCLIVDISAKGCKLRIKDSEKEKLSYLSKDETVQINTKLPGIRDIRIEGIIKLLDDNKEKTNVGIKFLPLPEKITNSLEAYLNEMRDLMR